MMMHIKRVGTRVTCCAAAMLVLGVAACKEDEAPKEIPQASKAEVAAKLAAADAADGTVDKVVGKCVMCALRMDGTAGHTATCEGYTLRFCADGCRKHFAEDPAAAVLALKIPEDEEP